MCANTTGTFNSAVGSSAMRENTSGANNTAMGSGALLANTAGIDNTATGANALAANTTGTNNVAMGANALSASVTTTGNTAVGSNAMAANTGGGNVGIGLLSLYANTSNNNTAVGNNSMQCNTTGGANATLGYCSLFNNTSGASNTAVGFQALYGNSTGSNNTAQGFNALYANTTGCNNVGLGYNSGNDALCSLTTQNDHVIVGNNTTAVIYGKVAFTNASDVRWKKVDESGVGLALPFVQALTPIKYQFCDPETGEVTDDRYRYGFSAQEVIEHEEIPEHPIIARIDNPEMFSLNETMFIPVLVNAIKELAAENADLKARIEALENA